MIFLVAGIIIVIVNLLVYAIYSSVENEVIRGILFVFWIFIIFLSPFCILLSPFFYLAFYSLLGFGPIA